MQRGVSASSKLCFEGKCCAERPGHEGGLCHSTVALHLARIQHPKD